MDRRAGGTWWAAAVMGVLLAASVSGAPGAQASTFVDPPSPSVSSGSDGWWGAEHPGQSDPSDPSGNDWHCDRLGNWHNDERDATGHQDSRCQSW